MEQSWPNTVTSTKMKVSGHRVSFNFDVDADVVTMEYQASRLIFMNQRSGVSMLRPFYLPGPEPKSKKPCYVKNGSYSIILTGSRAKAKKWGWMGGWFSQPEHSTQTQPSSGFAVFLVVRKKQTWFHMCDSVNAMKEAKQLPKVEHFSQVQSCTPTILGSLVVKPRMRSLFGKELSYFRFSTTYPASTHFLLTVGFSATGSHERKQMTEVDRTRQQAPTAAPRPALQDCSKTQNQLIFARKLSFFRKHPLISQKTKTQTCL